MLPLFLITLPRAEKSLEIFKLTGLCHIAVKVEAYRNQNGLTQCYNCQKFGCVWSNCSLPPRCMWCGGGHLHKDCPEKENTSSTPSCCNCKLADGEKPHPSNIRGCSIAKEGVRRTKSQGEQTNTTGRVSLQSVLPRFCPSRQRYAQTRSNSSLSSARLQYQVRPQGRSRRHRPHLRMGSKYHPLRSFLRHSREIRGFQQPRRTSGQPDIMIKVSQSGFHLIACNLWTTRSK
jgi:hypothetical protein